MLIDFASDSGYRFTVEEAEDELSDQLLGGVTGGASSTYLKVESAAAPTYSGHIKLSYEPITASFNFYKW
jgi:hypothetical protein